MAVKKSLLLLVLLAALVSVLPAQTTPAALTPSTMYVGAQPMSMNPDWGCPHASPFSCWNHQLFGVEAYAGLNQVWNRVGLEANVHWSSWRGVQLPTGNLKESSYVIGPTARIYARRTFKVSGNFLIGIGSITIPKGYGPGQGSYLIYSPSIHIEQRLTQSFQIRYQYEYQLWPGFTGLLGQHGLTPNGLGVGVTYQLHPRVY